MLAHYAGRMHPTSLISHESISRRAHQIWEEAGHPDGCETDHWLQAERDLHALHGKAGQPIAAKPVPSKVPHSTDYVHPGVTTDSLHHRRN
jgi:hypothetical protein